jgi:hypothetical protein
VFPNGEVWNMVLAMVIMIVKSLVTFFFFLIGCVCLLVHHVRPFINGDL